jgi:hypothetical protein
VVDAGELDLARDDVELRPRVPAVRAAVVAEVADVRRAIRVRRAAADAPLRVGRVLQLAPRVALVVEPEPHGLAPRVGERGHLRVVDVQDEDGGRGEVDGGGPPAVGDVLQLPVAVELVAEEVAEADGARPHPPRHLRQGGLVDLEEPELGAARLEERRRDARHEIRARVVVGEARAWPQDLGRHRRRRRLPVRRRHERRALRQSRGEPVDRARIDLPQELAGQRRAAAAAREPRQRAGRPGGRDLQRERHRDAHGAEPSGASPFRGIFAAASRRTAFGGFPRRARVVRSGTRGGHRPVVRVVSGGPAAPDGGRRRPSS